MEELIKKVEAVLFAAGKKVELAEIAKLCRKKPEEIEPTLKELQKKYENSDSPLMVIQDGSQWKLTTRESYMPLVKKIVADTELSKTVIETLAVVAWKQPVKQSDIIKIRTNKAYRHLDELEDMGFITRQKHGRTKLVRLTEKFMKYFELEGDKDIEELFKNVENRDTEKLKKYEEEKKKDKKKEESTEKLEVVDEEPEKEEIKKRDVLEYDEEKLGSLEVYEEEEDRKEKKKTSEEKRDDEEKKEEKETKQEAENASEQREQKKPKTRTQEIFGKKEEEKKEAKEEKPEEEKEKNVEVPPSSYDEKDLAELEKNVMGEKIHKFDSGEEEKEEDKKKC